PGLDVAVGPAGAEKHADAVVELLFEVEADAGAAHIGTHCIDVGRLSGCLRERDGVGEIAGASAAQEAGDLDLAGLAPEFVAFLDLADELELLESWIERIGARADASGRRDGEVEHAATQRPAAGIPCGN